jgi:hypothetical protein
VCVCVCVCAKVLTTCTILNVVGMAPTKNKNLSWTSKPKIYQVAEALVSAGAMIAQTSVQVTTSLGLQGQATFVLCTPTCTLHNLRDIHCTLDNQPSKCLAGHPFYWLVVQAWPDKSNSH